MYAAPPAAQASSTGLTGLDISSRLGMSSKYHQHTETGSAGVSVTFT